MDADVYRLAEYGIGYRYGWNLPSTGMTSPTVEGGDIRRSVETILGCCFRVRLVHSVDIYHNRKRHQAEAQRNIDLAIHIHICAGERGGGGRGDGATWGSACGRSGRFLGHVLGLQSIKRVRSI